MWPKTRAIGRDSADHRLARPRGASNALDATGIKPPVRHVLVRSEITSFGAGGHVASRPAHSATMWSTCQPSAQPRTRLMVGVSFLKAADVGPVAEMRAASALSGSRTGRPRDASPGIRDAQMVPRDRSSRCSACRWCCSVHVGDLKRPAQRRLPHRGRQAQVLLAEKLTAKSTG